MLFENACATENRLAFERIQNNRGGKSILTLILSTAFKFEGDEEFTYVADLIMYLSGRLTPSIRIRAVTNPAWKAAMTLMSDRKRPPQPELQNFSFEEYPMALSTFEDLYHLLSRHLTQSTLPSNV